MRAENVWLVLAAVFFLIGVVVSLGEWVFHWWDSPGEVIGPLSLMLALVTLGWSASARELRRIGGDLIEGQRHLLEGQDKLLQGQDKLLQGVGRLQEGQAEDRAAFREALAFFRRTDG